MKPKHWLALSLAAACAAESIACSSSFKSCTDSRTCAPTAGSGGQREADAGDPGSDTAGKPDQSSSGGEAGAQSAPELGGEGGEGGDMTTSNPSEAGQGGSAGDGAVMCDADVDLRADPKNCGSCGHDCLGGECALGTCQPVNLAQDQGRLFTVIVDSQFVYWGGDSAFISKMNLDGTGAIEPFVQKGAMEFSYDAVLAGNSLYWGNDWHDTGLRGCALPDCSGGPQTLIAGSSNVLSLAYDSKSKTIFWDQDDGIWHRVLPGGTATNFIPRQSKQVYNMTTDGVFIYWSESDKVTKQHALYKSPINTANVTALALGRPTIDGIAVQGNSLFFIEKTAIGTEIRAIPLPNGVGAGEPTLIGPGGAGATSVVADATGVYWTSSEAGGDSIKFCPLSGCLGTPKIVAPTVDPRGITADAKAVYWVTESGLVMKIAK